jgi:Ca-activated chloride channel family protein
MDERSVGSLLGGLALALLLGCDDTRPAESLDAAAGGGGAPSANDADEAVASTPAPEAVAAASLFAPLHEATLGRMSARRPGTSVEVQGVSLAEHRAEVTVRGGHATTTVEEVFHNETGEVLEGTFTFPLPRGAVVSDLALWVGDELVPAEIVPRQRARAVFQGIVDDTVRPRDPALLERHAGATLSLAIFPIPAHGSRRVRFSYEQALPRDGVDQTLAIRFSRASTRVGRFSIVVDADCDVTVDASPFPVKTRERRLVIEAADSRPTSDLLLRCVAEERATLATEDSPRGPVGLVRVRVPGGHDPASVVHGDLAVVVDRSFSQSGAELASSVAEVARLLADLQDDEGFVVLACDTACDTFPPDGLASATQAGSARAWLEAMGPAGGTDVRASLDAALARLSASDARRVVVLGDGAPSAGASLRAPAPLEDVDLRFVAKGESTDLGALEAWVGMLGGVVVERGFDPRAPQVSIGLDLPSGVHLVGPAQRRGLVGDEVQLPLRGSFDGPRMILRADVLGEQVETEVELTVVGAPPGLVARRVAAEEIAELEAMPTVDREAVVALSKESFILTRHTSMLVLENDAMFASFGIPRTRGDAVAALAQEAPLGASTGFGHGSHGFGPIGGGAPIGGGHKSASPRIRVGSTTVSGALPREVIERIVRQSFGRFRQCYEHQLAVQPALAGKVVIAFTIRPDGAVGAATVGENSTTPALGDCVARAFTRLSFPSLEGGATVRVSYPLIFAPPSDTPAASRVRETIGVGSDSWIGRADASALARRVAAEPERRSHRVALVRALIASGAFDAARSAAEELASIDPTTPSTRELLAEARLASGAIREAVVALEEVVELRPESFSAQRRAGRAWHALGDRARACGHFVAASELAPRAPELRRLAADCEAGRALSVRELGDLTPTVSCAPGKDCPVAAFVDPSGRVFGPWLPRADGHVGPGGEELGFWRVVLVGGSPDVDATVKLALDGVARETTTKRRDRVTAFIVGL